MILAMGKLDQQWIEIFRAGDYGEKGNFTPAVLDTIVSKYDPSFHEAPAVVGHPKDNLPAYAWFDALKREGTTLFGRMTQVDPKFEEMVQAGRFKKRSAAFYKSPSGEILGLRHVGFLGAQPPEVKGLSDCKFQDGNNEVIEVTFEEDSVAEDKTFMDRLDAWFAEKFGSRTPAAAAATFSEADARRIASEAVTAAITPLQAQIAEQKTKLEQQATQFSEREKVLGSAELKARVSDTIASLKEKGRWVPAFEKLGVSVLFSELASITTTIEFGEGDTRKQLTPFQIFTSFMEQLPAIVPKGTTYNGQLPRMPPPWTSESAPIRIR